MKKINFYLLGLLRLNRLTYRGFTLIELLVVITIIAILSSVGIVIYRNVQTNARISITKENLRNLQQAMIRYKIANGELPPTGDAWSCSNIPTNDETELRRVLNTLASSSNGGPYIDSSQIDNFIKDPWGSVYCYDDNDNNAGPAGAPCNGSSTGRSTNYLYSAGPDKNFSTGGDNINFSFICS